jgi:DNA-binding transcriptional ArsR family regulator
MDVFRAIADPTRRAILGLIAARERPVMELTRLVGGSQPGLSQHLRALREAGLVRVRRDGRRRIYSLRADPMDQVLEWIARLR